MTDEGVQKVVWMPKAEDEGDEEGYYRGAHVADLVRSAGGVWYVAPSGPWCPGTTLYRAATRAEAVAWAEAHAERLADPELYLSWRGG
jgi:hypothetical protein